jgi:chromate transport protein ChrA
MQDRPAEGMTSTSSVGYASGKKIATFISWLSTALATLLLVGAVVALYNTRSDNLKLGLIALFTVLFAASVGLLTNAKKVEVFGATAA